MSAKRRAKVREKAKRRRDRSTVRVVGIDKPGDVWTHIHSPPTAGNTHRFMVPMRDDGRLSDFAYVVEVATRMIDIIPTESLADLLPHLPPVGRAHIEGVLAQYRAERSGQWGHA